ncbi:MULTISPECIES: hypothetical protein [unclassified Shinella]|uniref:hypothetical protein n=1 Tax=unclassified Shinella TaxID=2643062 RepID=UPI00068374AE|nr:MULTISPECIES: hypothetical protein [unclassified Shinella]
MSRVVQRRDGQSGLLGLGSDGETVNAGMIGAGFLGIFGRGMYRVFNANENITIPANVKRIRVRVIGPGGSTAGVSAATNLSSGAGGGGYAHGAFDVTPGDVYAVTVGAPGAPGSSGANQAAASGTSSFGALISATGGQPGVNAPAGPVPGGLGGIGIGGDFQAKGGKGGDATANASPGSGGAAGSQLGDGGNGATVLTINDTPGGGGVGGNHASTCAAGSAFGPGGLYADKRVGGPDVLGEFNTVDGTLVENKIGATCRFPFDIFTGAASYSNNANAGARSGSGAGGPGGSGSVSPQPGGHGGGGGVGLGSSALPGGQGGIGGGAGSASGANKAGAQGGRGLVIVEW